jgi:hypothetical protein
MGPGVERLLAFWHLTSLDAPTVAVVWALAFAHATGVQLPLWVPAILALCAWSVYIGDRLLDAYRAMRTVRDLKMQPKTGDLRPRHHFHWKYRRILLPLSITSAVAAFALIVHFMPLAARERNSVLAVAALAYFTSVHSPWRPRTAWFRVPKELLVGILFTAACALPVWARLPANLPGRFLLLYPVSAFMALAWLNCHAIEVWESGISQSSRQVTRLALGFCGITLITAGIAAGLRQPHAAALLTTAALAAALTAWLDWKARRIAPTTLRALADIVLLTPLLLLLP